MLCKAGITGAAGAPAARTAARAASRARLPLVLVLAACALGALAAPSAAQTAETHGVLAIHTLGARTGRATPARLEVRDEAGGLHAPALALWAPGRCPDGSEPAWYGQLSADGPLPTVLRITAGVGEESGDSFYALDGSAMLGLPPGRYRVTAIKGPEFLRRSADVTIVAGETAEVSLPLARFVNMPLRGWFSGDDHVHIVRRDPTVNPLLASWMEAEDLHVANLLEMGTYRGTEAGAQFAFGTGGLYQRGRTILASGQENPRSWTLGHGIVLGNTSYIDFPDRYLDYRPVWAEAARQGARSGYAHWGGPAWPLDLPTGELDFLEVLQLDTGDYEDLYLAWDLGYPITPTAGSDYQCRYSGPPGAVRFYTRVEPPLTFAKWLAALDAGRTFVTNGPFLALDVEGTDVGGTVQLAAPRAVAVTASVHFDPERDEVLALEIVASGEVVHQVAVPEQSGTVRFAGTVAVDEPAWIAARVRGWKRDAPPVFGMRPASLAHTGSVLVGITGMPAELRPLRRDAARRARERVDALEEELEALRRRGSISELFNQFDSATLRRDWPLLEEALEASRRHYLDVEQR